MRARATRAAAPALSRAHARRVHGALTRARAQALADLLVSVALAPQIKARILDIVWRRAKEERLRAGSGGSGAGYAVGATTPSTSSGHGWLAQLRGASQAGRSWSACLESLKQQPGTKALPLLLALLAEESDLRAAASD